MTLLEKIILEFDKYAFLKLIKKIAIINLIVLTIILILLYFIRDYYIWFLIIYFIIFYYFLFSYFKIIKGYTNIVSIKDNKILFNISRNANIEIDINNIKTMNKLYNFNNKLLSFYDIRMYSEGLIFPSRYYKNQLYIELYRPITPSNRGKMINNKFKKFIIADNHNYSIYDYIINKSK